MSGARLREWPPRAAPHAPGLVPGADVQEPEVVCMAREIVGVVQDILDKATEKGQEYLVLRVEGEGYFDWKGLVAQKQVKAGDKVRLRVSDGQFPRIYDLEKLPDVEFTKAQVQAGTVPSARTGSRDEFITRLSCARTASMALSVVDMPVKEKVKELFHLAEELEKWVKRQPQREQPHGAAAPAGQ